MNKETQNIMKDVIKEFLSNYSDYYIDGNGKAHDVIRATPDELAEEIVKLFAIPSNGLRLCAAALDKF